MKDRTIVASMKMTIAFMLFFTSSLPPVLAQQATVRSPNEKIIVTLYNEQQTSKGGWYLTASYNDHGKVTVAIPRINLGLVRSDQDFSKELQWLKTGKW